MGQREQRKVSVLSVVCAVCGAKRGELCEQIDGTRRRSPHPERRRKAVRVRRDRERRARALAGQKRAKWASVTIRFKCPICGGDHARADHSRAGETLLERARRVHAEDGR
jgi:hypothetical protein